MCGRGVVPASPGPQALLRDEGTASSTTGGLPRGPSKLPRVPTLPRLRRLSRRAELPGWEASSPPGPLHALSPLSCPGSWLMRALAPSPRGDHRRRTRMDPRGKPRALRLSGTGQLRGGGEGQEEVGVWPSRARAVENKAMAAGEPTSALGLGARAGDWWLGSPRRAGGLLRALAGGICLPHQLPHTPTRGGPTTLLGSDTVLLGTGLSPLGPTRLPLPQLRMPVAILVVACASEQLAIDRRFQ